jgi:hypothetical protein
MEKLSYFQIYVIMKTEAMNPETGCLFQKRFMHLQKSKRNELNIMRLILKLQTKVLNLRN